MRSKILLFLVFIHSLHFFHAQKRIAVLIGNGNYSNIPKLENPTNEIDQLEKVCRSNKNFDIVLVFKNKAKSNSDFSDIFSQMESEIDTGAQLFIYYSGHGIQLNNTNYLIPLDIKEHPKSYEVAELSFNLNYLIERLYTLQGDYHNSSVVCIDACRNDPFGKSYFSSQSMGRVLGLPSNCTLIYSSQSGKKTLDQNPNRKEDPFSPFASELFNGIENCENWSSIIQRIDTEYKKLNLDNQVVMEGSIVQFSLCKGNPNTNLETLNSNLTNAPRTDYLNSETQIISMDFQKKDFQSVITHSSYLQSYIQQHPNLAKNEQQILLNAQKLQAISYFEIRKFDDAERIFNQLRNASLNSSQLDFYLEAYFYLGRIYTLTKNWKPLYDLRKEYLTYCLQNKLMMDAAITLDKLAGDFERSDLQDSAISCYKGAKKLITDLEKTQLDNDALYNCASIYANSGNCLGYGKNINWKQCLEDLQIAVDLGKQSENNYYPFLFALVSKQIEATGDLSDTAQVTKNINELSEMSQYSSENACERLEFLDLKLEYYKKLKNDQKIVDQMKTLNDLVASQNAFSVLLDTVSMKKNDECALKMRQLKIVVPKGVLPILFFDKNTNYSFDNKDVKIWPFGAERDSATVYEINYNSDNPLAMYEDVRVAKNYGEYPIYSNLSDNPKGKMMTNSSVYVYPHRENEEKTVWSFQLELEELRLTASESLYVGLKNCTISDGYQSKSVDYTPIFLGIDNLKYTLSIKD